VDLSRLRTGEIVAGGGGIILFASLFFDWFGGVGGFTGVSLDGWEGLGGDFTGFIVALTSVAGLTLASLCAADQRLNVPVPRGGVTAILGSLSVLIILWRFFANPGDLKFGIFLGLAAAVAVAAGALMALAEDGFRPLVAATSAAPTKVAAASAPPVPPSQPATSAPKKSAAKKSSSKKSSQKKAQAKKSQTKSTTAKEKSSASGAKSSGGKGSSGARKK
jgi:hypothetical protein